MSRADESAYPLHDAGQLMECGLTIREHFAAMAMSAWVHEYAPMPETYAVIATSSVGLADALIAELAKPVQPDPLLTEARSIVANFVMMMKDNGVTDRKYDSFAGRVRTFLEASRIAQP